MRGKENKARSGIARRAEPNPASPCKKEARKIMNKSNPYCSKMEVFLIDYIYNKMPRVGLLCYVLR